MKKLRLAYRAKRRVIAGLSIALLLMIYFFKDSSFILRASTAIALLVFFYITDHIFDIRFKPRHYAFIIVICILSLLLSPLYYVYPNYDKVQHFVQPILVASIIYHMVSHLKLELKWKITFAFFITVAILGLFEVGEYTFDYFFDWKLQGVYLRDAKGLQKFNLVLDPLDDTMVDIVFGVLGSALYALSLWGYIKVKSRKMYPIRRI